MGNTLFVLSLLLSLQLLQPPAAPSLRSGTLPDNIQVDGALDEPAWTGAEEIDEFTQVEPDEGALPSQRTTVKVLANASALVFGIVSHEPDPSGIVSFSVRRDAELDDEDHVRIVLGPFVDGRSGYVFAVNPSGARFDALIEPGGDDEVADWDAIWEAATARGPGGWSVEIRIPIQSLSFKHGERAWDFNVERRVQRRLETVRWASPQRQFEITQTSRAGRLTGDADPLAANVADRSVVRLLAAADHLGEQVDVVVALARHLFANGVQLLEKSWLPIHPG